MKKLFSVIGILVLFSLCSAAVFGLGLGTGTGGIGITANTTAVTTPYPPLIFVDKLSTLWINSAATADTAAYYGTPFTNVHGDTGVKISNRQNYAFEGELIEYYVIVEDGNGIADIASVDLLLMDSLDVESGIPGACGPAPADFADVSGFELLDYDGNPIAYDPAIMISFICSHIIQAAPTWNGLYDPIIRAVDLNGDSTDASTFGSIFLNPTLTLSMSGFPDFGTVAEGSTSISDTVYLGNLAQSRSGVMMDMYISSDDYFTDPSNPPPGAPCPTGNGLEYYNNPDAVPDSGDETGFSYYATKGSINSGENDNNFPGVSLLAAPDCVADAEGFTPLVAWTDALLDPDPSVPEPSGMCRIINHKREGSLLTQGSEMSITFKVDVPTPCLGSFTNGQFYFVGQVV